MPFDSTGTLATPTATRPVNRAACLQLADFIARAHYRFDMSSCEAEPLCGSAGCIGGHAAVLWPDVRESNAGVDFTWDEEKLAAKLGITRATHDALCYLAGENDDDDISDLSDVTRRMAVATLRRLAETGVVTFRPRRRP